MTPPLASEDKRVEGPRQKHLALILAREFASTLAMPVFVADDEGRLVFYNEPAEAILGKSYAEIGEVSAEEWTALFNPQAPDGQAVSFSERPTGIALTQRRPAHGEFRVTGFDGRKRQISVTAVPLFARGEDFVGVVAIFWEHG